MTNGSTIVYSFIILIEQMRKIKTIRQSQADGEKMQKILLTIARTPILLAILYLILIIIIAYMK